MRPLIWFRSDLRIADNTALHEACQVADDGVIAVFIICPDQWNDHDWSSVKVDFLLRNLAKLSQVLGALNIPLVVIEVPRFSEVPASLLELAETHRCDGLWFNLEYEVNEGLRDEEVERAFDRAGKVAHGYTDQVVLPPESIHTNQGKYYTVFTPYKARWIATVKEQGGTSTLPTPSRQKDLALAPDPIPAELREFPGLRRPDLWPSGEVEAHARLAAFAARSMQGYHVARDLPGTAGTSQLSPYLALGVLSPRQCLNAALKANGHQLDSGSEGVTTWISELIWREFYRHVLVGYPRVCMGQPFDRKAKSIAWRDDGAAFERWQKGRTGVPIVDAGMRQLAQTGWMHNRVRMITAMFLTKNLFVDWRRGEAWFMRSLVDGDFASNNGGWQWSASVGTDSVPYFRVFNPLRQSERFDAEGDYIREFVPELARVRGKAIHMPHERAPGMITASDYPAPIVELKATRQRAIDRFRKHASRG